MGIFSKRPRKGTVSRAEALKLMHDYGALSNFTLIPQNVNGETCYRIVTLEEERKTMEDLKNKRNLIRRNEFIERIKEENTDYKPNLGFKSYGNYGRKLDDCDISR